MATNTPKGSLKSAEQLRFEMDFKTVDGLHKSIRRIQTDALNWAYDQIIPDGNPVAARNRLEAKIKELEQ